MADAGRPAWQDLLDGRPDTASRPPSQRGVPGVETAASVATAPVATAPEVSASEVSAPEVSAPEVPGPVEPPGGTPVRSSRPAHGAAQRRDIQGLRAVAVLLVLAFHLWPGAVRGGFIGVDVFFVVSGFLITRLLARDLAVHGRVRLGDFWRRRARRLLPAALLTLSFCLLLTVTVIPVADRERFSGDVVAAAVYVVNWRLAFAAVDYMAAEDSPSIVQHFWSLSVEEQYYLLWPLLLTVLGVLALRAGGRRLLRPALVALTLVIVVGGLAYSWHATSGGGQDAYFVSTTRAWELAAGGLLAVSGLAAPRPQWLRLVLGWVGLAVVVGGALVISPADPFPGLVAVVPVLGALVVVLAGEPDGPAARWTWYRPGVLQRIGDLSYGIYLWHWPLLVALPFVLHRGLTVVDRIAVAVLTVAVAAASKRLVEDPLRFSWRFPRRDVAGTLGAAATAMALVCAVAAVGISSARAEVDRQAEVTAEVLAGDVSCLGAAMGLHGEDCRNDALDGVVVPSPATARTDSAKYCMTSNPSDELRICDFGVPVGRARLVVALLGDSHAAQWQAALEPLAAGRRWHVVTMLKGSCPFIAAERASSDEIRTSCRAWNAKARAALAERSDIDVVITAGSSKNQLVPQDDLTGFETAVRGYRRAWASLPDSVTDVWVLRDTPRMPIDVQDCLARQSVPQLLRFGTCGQPRSDAFFPDPATEAASRSTAVPGRHLHVIDLTGLMCTSDLCPAVIGHALVFRDSHHLTRTFARTLTPFLAQELAHPVTSGTT